MQPAASFDPRRPEPRPELRHMPVIVVILLSVITGGIYTGVWYLRQREGLNALRAGEKVGPGIGVSIIVLASLSIVAAIFDFSALAQGDRAGAGLWQLGQNLLSLAAGIVSIVGAFQVRRILRTQYNDLDHAGILFSGVMTFFFTAYYMQYKINRLPPPNPTSTSAAPVVAPPAW